MINEWNQNWVEDLQEKWKMCMSEVKDGAKKLRKSWKRFGKKQVDDCERSEEWDFNEVECRTICTKIKDFWHPQKPKVSGTPKMFCIFQCARNPRDFRAYQMDFHLCRTCVPAQQEAVPVELSFMLQLMSNL